MNEPRWTNSPWAGISFDAQDAAFDVRVDEFRRNYECEWRPEPRSLQGPWIFDGRLGSGAVYTRPVEGRPHGAVICHVGNHPGFVNRLDIGAAISAVPDMINALRAAEAFMAGFEGDEGQEGIGEKLALIRRALAPTAGIEA